ncbi:unnamed protein product [Prunus armeniaca]
MTWGHVHHPSNQMVGSLLMYTQRQNILIAQHGQNGLGRTMAIDQNDLDRDPAIGLDHVLVEDVMEVAGILILRPNSATSLEFQQFMCDIETMAQTIATQNAQINERLDRLLSQPNQGAPNEVNPPNQIH